MPVYNNNILPTSFNNWYRYNVSNAGMYISNVSDNSNLANSYAYYTRNTTGFSTKTSGLAILPACTGDWYFYVYFMDNSNSCTKVETFKFGSTERRVVIDLEESTTSSLVFVVRSRSSSSGYRCYVPQFMFVEMGIRSVDIEYAAGTSKANAPTTGWQSNAPDWSSDKYIWQRTATTFIDGHTEYSDPILTQTMITSGISAITEQYYKSRYSTYQSDGSWETECPSWESGYYIWTRSKVDWYDGTTTYTTPVLAQALNQANAKAKEAADAVIALDNNLNQEEIFNRLTNKGAAKGLYLTNGELYLSASYIETGVITVRTGPSTGYPILFRASMDANEVYIAGFKTGWYSSTRGYLYTDSKTTLNDKTKGIYIGTDGFGSADGYSYIYLSQGVLSGGYSTNGDGGCVRFNRACRVGTTTCYGISIESDNFIFLNSNSLFIKSESGYAEAQSGRTEYFLYNHQTTSGSFQLSTNTIYNVATDMTGWIKNGYGDVTWYNTEFTYVTGWYGTLYNYWHSFNTKSLYFTSGIETGAI